MDVGVAVFAGSYGLAPPALGRAVESRGFESLFYAEHTHIPVASRRPDGRPVRPFAETYDPFVALSAVAAVTTTLKVGTGVCLVTERDPDHHREGGGEPRPHRRGALPVRRGGRMEP